MAPIHFTLGQSEARRLASDAHVAVDFEATSGLFVG
jgi:hypothetical protein